MPMDDWPWKPPPKLDILTQGPVYVQDRGHSPKLCIYMTESK